MITIMQQTPACDHSQFTESNIVTYYNSCQINTLTKNYVVTVRFSPVFQCAYALPKGNGNQRYNPSKSKSQNQNCTTVPYLCREILCDVLLLITCDANVHQQARLLAFDYAYIQCKQVGLKL